MTTCDFEVEVEIHEGVTATILGNLNDRSNGLTVGVPLADLEDVMDTILADSPFVLGNFAVTSKPSAGVLELVLTAKGATWPEMMANYRTARDWWRQTGLFHVDVTLQGETTRYLARRPNAISARLDPNTLLTNTRSWVVTFPVQPNPVVL